MGSLKWQVNCSDSDEDSADSDRESNVSDKHSAVSDGESTVSGEDSTSSDEESTVFEKKLVAKSLASKVTGKRVGNGKVNILVKHLRESNTSNEILIFSKHGM